MTCPKCHGSTKPCADCAARNFPPDSATGGEEHDAGWARRWQADVDGLRAELARVTAERDAARAALAALAECAANLIAVVNADPVADGEAYRTTCAALGAARKVLAR